MLKRISFAMAVVALFVSILVVPVDVRASGWEKSSINGAHTSGQAESPTSADPATDDTNTTSPAGDAADTEVENAANVQATDDNANLWLIGGLIVAMLLTAVLYQASRRIQATSTKPAAIPVASIAKTKKSIAKKKPAKVTTGPRSKGAKKPTPKAKK